MSMKITTLAALIGLAGCSSQQAKPGAVISLDCHGDEWVLCYRLATNQCGKPGFTVINQITDAGSTATSLNDSLTQGAQVQRSLVVRCNTPAP